MFDVLNSSNSLTLEEVAGQINASVLGTERLLEAAVSLGLLERVKPQDTSGKIYILPFNHINGVTVEEITCGFPKCEF